MASYIRKLRGTAEDLLKYFIPSKVPAAVLAVNTDDFDVHVSDGKTPGGLPLIGRMQERMEAYVAAKIKEALQTVATIPTGTVAAFAMNAAPAGWLKCNGQLRYKRDFPQLYAVIGQQFGGDGSGDDLRFGVPELRGEFIRGWIDDRLNNSTNGPNTQKGRSLGGWEAASLARHQHEFTSDWIVGHSHMNGVHTFGYNAQGSNSGSRPAEIGMDSGYRTAEDGAHNVHGWTAFVGSDETRPQNVALLYCIKT